MKKPRLWVVETEARLRLGSWLPTVGCELSRDEARQVLRKWNAANPGDLFRLVPYERVEPPKRKKTGR